MLRLISYFCILTSLLWNYYILGKPPNKKAELQEINPFTNPTPEGLQIDKQLFNEFEKQWLENRLNESRTGEQPILPEKSHSLNQTIPTSSTIGEEVKSANQDKTATESTEQEIPKNREEFQNIFKDFENKYVVRDPDVKIVNNLENQFVIDFTIQENPKNSKADIFKDSENKTATFSEAKFTRDLANNLVVTNTEIIVVKDLENKTCTPSTVQENPKNSTAETLKDSEEKIVKDLESKIVKQCPIQEIPQNTIAEIVKDSEEKIVKDLESKIVKQCPIQGIPQNTIPEIVKDSEEKIVKDLEEKIVKDLEEKIVKDLEDKIVKDLENKILKECPIQENPQTTIIEIVKDSDEKIVKDSEDKIVKDLENKILKQCPIQENPQPTIMKDSKVKILKGSEVEIVKDSEEKIVKDSEFEIVKNSEEKIVKIEENPKNTIVVKDCETNTIKMSENNQIDKEIDSPKRDSEMEELSLRLKNYETELDLLKEQSKDQTNRIDILTKENEKLNKLLKDGYEHDSESTRLKQENEAVREHLAAMEISFNDVHKKYERVKAVVEGYKSNDEILKNTVKMLEESLTKEASRYELLKAHAKTQIDKANRENANLKAGHDQEVKQLSTLTKRLEIKVNALQENLEQKSKECDELSALYDEITGKKF